MTERKAAIIAIVSSLIIIALLIPTMWQAINEDAYCGQPITPPSTGPQDKPE